MLGEALREAKMLLDCHRMGVSVKPFAVFLGAELGSETIPCAIIMQQANGGTLQDLIRQVTAFLLLLLCLPCLQPTSICLPHPAFPFSTEVDRMCRLFTPAYLSRLLCHALAFSMPPCIRLSCREQHAGKLPLTGR